MELRKRSISIQKLCRDKANRGFKPEGCDDDVNPLYMLMVLQLVCLLQLD